MSGGGCDLPMGRKTNAAGFFFFFFIFFFYMARFTVVLV
jgi:hypothetical protein